MITASAFERELVQCRHVLQRAAIGLFRHRENAEDAVQDTYLRALERRDRFCGGSLLGWLYTILRNLFRDHVRTRGRVEYHGGLQYAEHVECSTDTHAIFESRQSVDLLERLPPQTRNAMLRAALGDSAEEIAAQLGITPSCARKILERGRDSLRDLIDPPIANGKAA